MIHILVKLEIKDFSALEVFEKQASVIMEKYQGRIVSAFETMRGSDGSGEEIHILEFPSEEAFSHYRSDNSLASLAGQRAQAISNTELTISLCVKKYF
mgnify:CR=1 FL=1